MMEYATRPGRTTATRKHGRPLTDGPSLKGVLDSYGGWQPAYSRGGHRIKVKLTPGAQEQMGGILKRGGTPRANRWQGPGDTRGLEGFTITEVREDTEVRRRRYGSRSARLSRQQRQRRLRELRV